MAEIKTAGLTFRTGGDRPLPPSAGKPVARRQDSSGKTVDSHGTSAGVIHDNPA